MRFSLSLFLLFLLICLMFSSGCDYVANNDIVFIKLDSRGNTEFIRTFDAGFDDTAQNIIETDGGGYAIASGVSHERIGGTHAQVIRLSSDGKTIWTTEINDSFGEAISIIQTREGDIITGTYWGKVSKLDRDGNVQWSTALDVDPVWSIAEGKNSSYIIPGKEFNGSHTLPTVTRIDDSGKIVWRRQYGGYQYGTAESILKREEKDEYIIAGRVDTSSSPDPLNGTMRTFLAAIHENGDLAWWKVEETVSTFRPLMREQKGGFSLLFSRSYLTPDNRYILESDEAVFDDQGNMLSIHAIGRAGMSQWTRDGGYLLAGYPESRDPEQYHPDQSPFNSRLDPMHVIKIDARGGKIFEKEISKPVTTDVRALLQTSDGGYAILADRDNQKN